MEWKRLNAWAGIIIFLLLMAWFSNSIINEVKLSNNAKFSIGTTTGWHKSSKGVFVYYEFLVGEKVFKNTFPMGKYDPITDGGRYYVKYLPSDPEVSRIMWENPVPPHIREVPSDGWKKLPK